MYGSPLNQNYIRNYFIDKFSKVILTTPFIRKASSHNIQNHI